MKAILLVVLFTLIVPFVQAQEVVIAQDLSRSVRAQNNAQDLTFTMAPKLNTFLANLRQEFASVKIMNAWQITHHPLRHGELAIPNQMLKATVAGKTAYIVDPHDLAMCEFIIEAKNETGIFQIVVGYHTDRSDNEWDFQILRQKNNNSICQRHESVPADAFSCLLDHYIKEY